LGELERTPHCRSRGRDVNNPRNLAESETFDRIIAGPATLVQFGTNFAIVPISSGVMTAYVIIVLIRRSILKAISLFAGCGGLDFGAEQAGAVLTYANEIEVDACSTLRQYFPHVDVDCRDIKSVRSFPDADLVLGGYPCQSFSMGGNRDPAKDNRTFLYREFARCIAQTQPRFFVAENVSGLRQIAGGSFLREQFDAFETAGELGYRSLPHLSTRKTLAFRKLENDFC
jgi:C-5 cytosine-specific DNA methylase